MIPDYQSLMLPLLRHVSDRSEHKFRDVIESLGAQFKLSEDERKELLPSGVQPIFDNRVGWAKTYLKKAGLIDTSKRATLKITDRGLGVLKENPDRINVKFLKRFWEFVEFHTGKSVDGEPETQRETHDEQSTRTPEETLEEAYQKIRTSLAQDLLNRVMALSPSFFERLVVELLVKMGYGGSIQDAGRAIGRSGDEGIDGTIKEDKLGLDIIYIQAKRWSSVVGRPELQKFVGALAGQGAKKGIFLTTSSFTKDARDYIPRNETKIVLIDGEQLAQLMIDYNLGVTTVTSYEVKRIDSDYFGED